jgi:hypothetical protein
MSGWANQYAAIMDADRAWWECHPRRRHRVRVALIEEVRVMAGQQVSEQPYSAIMCRSHANLSFRKIVAPECFPANLPEKRAMAAWRFWVGEAPPSWRED